MRLAAECLNKSSSLNITPVIRSAIVAFALLASGLYTLPHAGAQPGNTTASNTTSKTETGDKFKAKKVNGTLFYLPDTVNPDRLNRLRNLSIEVRGIISSYQGIKERYRFTTDDGASIIVVGNFPSQGGVTYYLRARVIEEGKTLVLAESAKQTHPFDEKERSDPNTLLLIGGGILILAALGTLSAMMMRNKAAEQRRLLEQQLEEERRRNIESPKPNKSGGRGEVGGPGGTVVAGASGGVSGGAAGRGRTPNCTVASRGTVKVEAGPNAPGTFPLVDGETRIGRKAEENCSVVLDKDAAVSSYHSSIIVTRDGRLVYEDKSSNGSVVDGQFVQRTQRDIQSGSQIKIGATTLVIELFAPSLSTPPASGTPSASNDTAARRAATVNIQSPVAEAPRSVAAPTAVGYGAELEVTAGPETGRRFPITKAITTLGREDRDILLGDASVSRSHATLTVRDGKFFISDDGSAHGTRVNGQVLTGEQEIHDGDEIVLSGKTSMTFHSVT